MSRKNSLLCCWSHMAGLRSLAGSITGWGPQTKRNNDMLGPFDVSQIVGLYEAKNGMTGQTVEAAGMGGFGVKCVSRKPHYYDKIGIKVIYCNLSECYIFICCPIKALC